jgi:hypothetical protein
LWTLRDKGGGMIQSVRELIDACKKLVAEREAQEARQFDNIKWVRNKITPRRVKDAILQR